jgi:hypothetical protein
MVEQLADGIWVARQPLSTLGVQYGARMTIIKLTQGGLLVVSPIKLTDELLGRVKALGDVRFLLAPSSFHHIFLKPWCEALPNAQLLLLEQHIKKRPDLVASYVIDERFVPPWGDDVEVLLMRGSKMYSEAVLYHRPSRTLVVTDLCFHMQVVQGLFSKAILSIYGVYRRFGPSKAVALLIRDKAYLRRIVDKIAEWDFTRVVVAHGEVADPLTPEMFRNAFRELGW